MNIFTSVNNKRYKHDVLVVAANTAKEAKNVMRMEYRGDEALLDSIKHYVFKQLSDAQYQGTEPKVLLAHFD